MSIKIEGWKVTIHNENGDRLELKGEFEAEFFKEYENKQLNIGAVSGSYFKILDKDGIEMPDHYSGRRRTYGEVKKMLDILNKNGEYRPYTMVEV